MGASAPTFLFDFFKDLCYNKEKEQEDMSMDKQTLYDEMIDEYFNRHPDAGLAWWQLPVEQQPEGFKCEMYDILWDMLNKEK